MRIALVFLCAAFAAAAPNPRPQDGPTDAESDEPTLASTTTVVDTTASIPLPTLPIPPNVTVTDPVSPITSSATLPTEITSYFSRSKTRKPHTEPIPIFTSNCGCPSLATMAYPCYAYDALNRCIFEENHSLGCHFMNAGCPSPTRTCANLFKPTPPTGKHPCDLSPPAETTESITSATPTVMPTITAVPRAA